MKHCDHQLPQAVVIGKCHSHHSGSPNLGSARPDGPSKRFRRYAAAVVLCLLSQLCWVHNLQAQNTATSTITGTVTDPSGLVIASAIVTVQNEATHVSVTVKTSNSGDYNVPFLQPEAIKWL